MLAADLTPRLRISTNLASLSSLPDKMIMDKRNSCVNSAIYQEIAPPWSLTSAILDRDDPDVVLLHRPHGILSRAGTKETTSA